MDIKAREELQKEIVDSLPLKPHGTLLLSPRLGKTKIVLDIIKANNPESILWVTPLGELAEKDIPNEFDKFKMKRYKKKLQTVTWASLSKVDGHKTMIILDEEQYATENNLINILSGKLSYDYIISMTGTESRTGNKQDLYRKLNLEILYNFDINQAVNADILADYTINVVKIPMSLDNNILAGNAKNRFYTSEEKQYAYLDKVVRNSHPAKAMFPILARRRAIINSPSKDKIAKDLVANLSGRKLIFAGSIKQASELCPQTYHSKTDNTYLRMFINNEINTLSLVNSGGTGVTYTGIDHLILTQVDKDNNGLTSQKIARTLLKQGEDYKATIWILCLKETQDEVWVKSTLERFDESKVNYIEVGRNYKINQNAF